MNKRGKVSLCIQQLPWELASLGRFGCLSRTHNPHGHWKLVLAPTALKGRGTNALPQRVVNHMRTLRQGSHLAGLGG